MYEQGVEGSVRLGAQSESTSPSIHTSPMLRNTDVHKIHALLQSEKRCEDGNIS